MKWTILKVPDIPGVWGDDVPPSPMIMGMLELVGVQFPLGVM